MFEVALISCKDEKKWLEIINRLDLKDPHYLPAYLQIYENKENRQSFLNFGGQGMLFVYGDSTNFIIYPFFKRSIADLPFSELSTDGLFDIASPYGYGGPLAQIEDETFSEELWRGFFVRFHEFCRQNSIVSEFCRLHPLFENHVPVSRFSQGVTQKLGQIVYVDLNRSEEDILAAMGHSRQRYVRKGLNNPELVYCLAKQDIHPDTFFDIYVETMQRNGAHKKYFFSQQFFEVAFRILGEHISLAHVHSKGDIISACLLLRHGDIEYSWLAANKADYFRMRANDVLFYRSFLESRRVGSRYFVLGGGLSSADDGLLTYKKSLSNCLKDFYVYKKIHLESEYSELVRLRNRYVKEPPGDFFPEYRHY